MREARVGVGGDDFVFSHTENSTVSVPVWMVKTGLAAGQTSTFAPQLKVKTNKTPRFVFYRSREKKKGTAILRVLV